MPHASRRPYPFADPSGMLCPGCWKDVPDLIGPDDGLCPECYGIAAEELIPSLLKDWVSGAEELDEEAPWESLDRLLGWDELDIFGGAHLSELSWLWEDQDDNETPPPFLGRPRFS